MLHMQEVCKWAVEDIGQAAGNCMVLSRHIHRNGLCIATPGFLLFHSQALEKLLFRYLMIFCDIPWRKFTLQLLLLVELLHLPWKKEKRATYLHSISHCLALLHWDQRCYLLSTSQTQQFALHLVFWLLHTAAAQTQICACLVVHITPYYTPLPV